MNGIDKSDVAESRSRHVKVKTENDKSHIVKSGSGYVKNKTLNNRQREDENIAVKPSYVSSSAVSEGHSDIVEGYSSASHNCADAESRQINTSVAIVAGTALEQMEILPESAGESVGSSNVSEMSSSSLNSCVLSASCDLSSADTSSADTSPVGTQLALSSPADTKLQHDLSLRTLNRETATDDSGPVVVGIHCEGSEEQQQINCQPISPKLPTVHKDHKEGDEADRSQVPTNCHLMSAQPKSDNWRTINDEGSETGRQHQSSGMSRDYSGESDRQQRPLFNHDNLPETHNVSVETGQRTACRLSAAHSEGSETDEHRLVNCQSPTVCSTGGDETDRCINCILTSDNLANAHNVGIETERKINAQMQTEGSETGHHRPTDFRLPKVEYKGGETDRPVNSQRLSAVQKHQMLVDCDVNVPHNVWTTVVNHNSNMSDDSPAEIHSQSEVYSLRQEVSSLSLSIIIIVVVVLDPLLVNFIRRKILRAS